LGAEARDHGGVNRSEEMMAKNLKISRASRVGDASANFRKKQSTYLKSMFRSI
jgi:syntaxin 16